MEAISATTFYGLSQIHHDNKEGDNNEEGEVACKKFKSNSREILRMPKTLLGPTETWREFNKQSDAIDFIKANGTLSDPLALFVYQNAEGFRHFVVAHPEVYWWYYNQQLPEQKCSYEVIMENEPSYLYFDLEYNKDLNADKDGVKMTSLLIDIVTSYFLKYWDLKIKKQEIMNLDSTSEVKFSRHLIFNTKKIAFANNYHVGKFVKQVCNDVLDYVIDNKENDVLKFFKKDHLRELIIMTDKGKRLFIDIAVYTKNRHFRILNSTKWGKQSYLKIAPDCTYSIDKVSKKDKELNLFLHSLISFFPDKSELRLLEFVSKDEVHINRFIDESKLGNVSKASEKYVTSQKSPYPELDKYISEIIKPGRIRCCKQYPELNTIVYEILGNRYCANIGRSHKSNNIYWVVDLATKCRFQRCHDEDCRGFSSDPESLPEAVCFHFNDDLDICLSNLTDTEQIINN